MNPQIPPLIAKSYQNHSKKGKIPPQDFLFRLESMKKVFIMGTLSPRAKVRYTTQGCLFS